MPQKQLRFQTPKRKPVSSSSSWAWIGTPITSRVVRMCDGQSPQPAQRFTPASFLPLVQKQLTLADQVFVVYEAGPGGFHLHRQLTALGVTAFVVHPQKLDPQHKGVVTDETDARELTLNLDRYLRGNVRALSVIRVPTPAEEQRRALSRQREQLRRERQRLAAQGRSLCLTQGIRLRGEWWKAPLTLPDWLEERLAIWRQLHRRRRNPAGNADPTS